MYYKFIVAISFDILRVNCADEELKNDYNWCWGNNKKFINVKRDSIRNIQGAIS